MAYYYVKSGGTATTDAGRETVKRTGTWNASAADYFPSLRACFTTGGTAVAPDDEVLISDVSSHAYGNSGMNIGIATAAPNNGAKIIAVDDANQENLSDLTSRPTETFSGTSGYANFAAGVTGGQASVYGLKLTNTTGYAIYAATSNSRLKMDRCELHGGNSTYGTIRMVGDGSYILLRDCILNNTTANRPLISVHGGGRIEILGGSIGASPATMVSLFGVSAQTGGCSIYVEGFDMTNMTDAGTCYLIGTFGGAVGFDDVTFARFVNCKVPANVGLVKETLLNTGSKMDVEFIGVDDTNHYRYERYCDGAIAKIVTTPYVTAQEQLQGGTQATLEIATSTYFTRTAVPFTVPLPVHNKDLSNTASDTITVKIATSGSLTLDDKDIRLVVRASDTTTPLLATFKASGDVWGDWVPDPWSTGTALSTSSSAWTGTINAEYELAVTMASVDGLPPIIHSAWLEVMCDTDKDSAGDKIYVNTELEFS